MKTDSQLERDVLDQLRFEPSVRETEIAVSAKDGVVTLSGFVDSYAEKRDTVRAVEGLNGVCAAVDNLEVRLPVTSTRSDTDIAHTALNALRWDTQVPHDQIRMTVRDGWITLDGQVDWQYQRAAAEHALQNLMGVRGVTNLIAVQPASASTYDVSQLIKQTLRRSAEVDADAITVEAHGGTVTLKGTVHSFAERRDAERAAWAAPGVTRVDDRIAVTI